MLNTISTRNRSPFTPTQWQELEHQALIYKYMVSGVPIPPELIYSVKRSLESSLATTLFPHQSIGWGCFQVGFGRKADPEPGRCRRTDGKKWRCSKEAYPDSKYCERHMHRGRNRSRKPLELTNSTTATTPTIGMSPSPSVNRNFSSVAAAAATSLPSGSSYPFSPLSSSVEPDLFNGHQCSVRNPFLYPLPSSSSPSSRPPDSGFSTQNSILDSGSCSHADKKYRYFQGIREGLDERALLPESSIKDSYHSLTMSSYKGYSHSQLESLAANTISEQQDDDQEQHCFVLGTDFKSSATTSTTKEIKLEKEAETQKPLHHFFGDQWPPKNSESWLDLASTTSRLQN